MHCRYRNRSSSCTTHQQLNMHVTGSLDHSTKPALIPSLPCNLETGLNETYYQKIQNSKFQIQVGCHADQLYHIKNDELNRPPNIILEYPATDETLKIASPFGGLIYILVSFKFDCTYFLVATNFLHVVLSIFLTTYYN